MFNQRTRKALPMFYKAEVLLWDGVTTAQAVALQTLVPPAREAFGGITDEEAADKAKGMVTHLQKLTHLGPPTTLEGGGLGCTLPVFVAYINDVLVLGISLDDPHPEENEVKVEALVSIPDDVPPPRMGDYAFLVTRPRGTGQIAAMKSVTLVLPLDEHRWADGTSNLPLGYLEELLRFAEV